MADGPVKYIAIDPGETSGWATFNAEGMVVDYGQVKQDAFQDWITQLFRDEPEIKVAIVEDYRNHGWTQQKKWSRNQTSKNIGSIETMCHMFNVEIVLQSNQFKGIGYMWAGIKMPANHSISHQYDGYAHGVYYLQQKGIRPVGHSIPKDEK